MKEPKIKWNRRGQQWIKDHSQTAQEIFDQMDAQAARESIKEQTPNPRTAWGGRIRRKDEDR